MLLSFSLQANIFAGDGKIEILNSNTIAISTSEFMADFIVSSTLNSEDENLDLLFSSKINMIQVFDNNDKIVSVLVIGSDELRIALNIFNEGNYKLGFLIEGEPNIQYADVVIK